MTRWWPVENAIVSTDKCVCGSAKCKQKPTTYYIRFGMATLFTASNITLCFENGISDTYGKSSSNIIQGGSRIKQKVMCYGIMWLLEHLPVEILKIIKDFCIRQFPRDCWYYLPDDLNGWGRHVSPSRIWIVEAMSGW